MPHRAQPPMDGRTSPPHLAAQGQGQGLHAQAHAQDRDASRMWVSLLDPRRPAQEVEAHAHVARDGGRAGAGGDNDVVPFPGLQAGAEGGPG